MNLKFFWISSEKFQIYLIFFEKKLLSTYGFLVFLFLKIWILIQYFRGPSCSYWNCSPQIPCCCDVNNQSINPDDCLCNQSYPLYFCFEGLLLILISLSKLLVTDCDVNNQSINPDDCLWYPAVSHSFVMKKFTLLTLCSQASFTQSPISCKLSWVMARVKPSHVLWNGLSGTILVHLWYHSVLPLVQLWYHLVIQLVQLSICTTSMFISSGIFIISMLISNSSPLVVEMLWNFSSSMHCNVLSGTIMDSKGEIVMDLQYHGISFSSRCRIVSGISCDLVESGGISWYIVVYRCKSWYIVVYRGISWYLVVYRGISWDILWDIVLFTLLNSFRDLRHIDIVHSQSETVINCWDHNNKKVISMTSLLFISMTSLLFWIRIWCQKSWLLDCLWYPALLTQSHTFMSRWE